MNYYPCVAIFYLILLLQADNTDMLPEGHTGLLLDWSGYEWQAKLKDQPAGPGPNLFGLHRDNLIITRSKKLKLSIQKVEHGLSCAELFTTEFLRNGILYFEIDGNARDLHPQVVGGLFTYNENREMHFNETDVEISRWGIENDKQAQFVHYPENDVPEVFRFHLSEKSNVHTFIIHKSDGVINFYYLDRKFSPGIPSLKQTRVFQRFSNTTHQPDYFRVHINLWLFKGKAPAELSKSGLLNFTVNRFEYLPD